MAKMAKKSITKKLDSELLLLGQQLEIELNAYESGFYQRSPKKITATSLFVSMWQMQHLGKNTLRNWAVQLGQQTGQTVTKQSLNERLTDKSVELAKLTLAKALNQKMDVAGMDREQKKIDKTLRPFNRILIRDSTTQQLPTQLHDVFKGSYSHGESTAIMRIQALFNFSQKRWENFQIGSWTDNDQSAAACIAPFLQPKDLLLQDLGYFTLEWIAQLTENQFLISKWHQQTFLFDDKHNKIDLITLLKDQKQLDKAVLLGNKMKLPMRLVARKLPKAKARKRIEQASKDRHSKANHSEQYYELLKYEIYVTNVNKELLSPKQIAVLYGLRWYIEILFKSWKSYANFKKMFGKEPMNLQRVLFTCYALLIEFVWFTAIYNYMQRKIESINPDKYLSILKFMDTLNDCFEPIINITTLKELGPIIPQFAKHATYEKHPKRQNAIQKYLYVNELCISKK